MSDTLFCGVLYRYLVFRNYSSVSKTGSHADYRNRTQTPLVILFCLLLCLPLAKSTDTIAAETSAVQFENAGSIVYPFAFDLDISSDGRFLIWEGSTSGLFSDPTINGSGVMVFDRQTNTVELASVDSAGNQLSGSGNPSISTNGRYVAFSAINDTIFQALGIFVRDRFTGITELIDVPADGINQFRSSRNPFISNNGRHVMYQSDRSNLVPMDTNVSTDVFVRDRVLNTTSRVSVNDSGIEGNGDSFVGSISDNGLFAVFSSSSTNLSPLSTGTTSQIYRHNLQTGVTEMASWRLKVDPINPTGSIVVGDNFSQSPDISDDGRFVVFQSGAQNLTDDNYDAMINDGLSILLRDMNTFSLTLISRSSHGDAGNKISVAPGITSDGRYISFHSEANNLLTGDTNNAMDLFLFDRTIAKMERVNVNSKESQGFGQSYTTGENNINSLTADGRFHVFSFNGVALEVGAPANGAIYVRDRGEDCDVNAAANQFELPDNQWRLIALPCEPFPGSTIFDMFGDDIAGDFGTDWVTFRYDPTLIPPRYADSFATDTLKAGQGVWIIQDNDANTSVTLDLPLGSRQATGVPTSECSPAADECFRLELTGAPNTSVLWNMIGNPFPATVPLDYDDLRALTTAGVCANGCTMAEAAAPTANVMHNQFFYYDGTNYLVRESGSTLEPWEGYWVPELPGSEFNDPVILVPR